MNEVKNSGKKPSILVVSVVAVLVPLLGIIGIMALSNDDNNEQSRSNVTEKTSKTNEETVTSAKPNEVAINKGFTDELGYTTTVTRIIRDYPATSEYDRKSLSEKNRELILVEYKISKNDSEVNGGSPTASRLNIKVADGAEADASYKITKEELKAAGYTPLVADSPKNGESKTGVVLYEVPKGEEKLSLHYHLKANVIWGDDVDKEYIVDLY